MLFCGIDLHSNNCPVVVSDDADKVVYSKRLPNDLAVICDALSPYQRELFGVVVESTYNWYWLVDGLAAAGYSLHLANTTAIKQYDGHLRDQVPLRDIAKRLGISRNALRRYLRSETTEPAYAKRQSASAIAPSAFHSQAGSRPRRPNHASKDAASSSFTKSLSI